MNVQLKLNPGFFVALLFACLNDADRTNPLDPKSGSQNTGSISGQTLSYYSPFSTVPGVEIRLEPGPFVKISDVQGRYVFSDLAVGRYKIRAFKDGYADALLDSIQIQLQQVATIDINLDALPQMAGSSITSSHISRWWPQTDLLLLAANVRVQDSDGLNDIVTVELMIPDLNFIDTLSVTGSPGVFQTQILESQLPGRNLQEVLGRQIVIRAKDRAGFSNNSTPQFVVRIIDDVPITLSPQGLETVATTNPTLQWQAVNQPYQFSYLVELYRVDFGINNLVWQSDAIEHTTTETVVPDNLAAGTYFWTIAIVDEFGNMSRSKEASFQVN